MHIRDIKLKSSFLSLVNCNFAKRASNVIKSSHYDRPNELANERQKKVLFADLFCNRNGKRKNILFRVIWFFCRFSFAVKLFSIAFRWERFFESFSSKTIKWKSFGHSLNTKISYFSSSFCLNLISTLRKTAVENFPWRIFRFSATQKWKK